MKRKLGSRLGLVLLAAVALQAGLAPRAGAVEYTGKEYNPLFAGLGAKGYDVVSYFTGGKPAMGSETYAFDYRGVSWRFASAAHSGWTIQDGRLYLSFNAELNGVFRGDPKRFIAKADKNWPKLDR